VATVILENVNVDFPIYGAQQRSLHKAIFKRATGGAIERDGRNQDRVTVKALSDISLTLHDGDRLGLIGHNGSGKSTLLKLIAGIYQPVSGHIKVDGRVTPLFDAMPGLDGEDSGYENIITSGMLIGMTREQIEAKIPEIEEFCELGEYLSLPVRTYSTGMTMRLGFALVTALEPGVLLMDEGFGTGDLRFAERAEARMKDFIGRSRIMVLASHSDNTIRSMCNKAVLMDAGRIVAFGPVDDVCEQYYKSVHAATMASQQSRQLEAIATHATSYSEAAIENVGVVNRLSRSSGSVWFTRVVALDADGKSKWEYFSEDTVRFLVEYEVRRPVRDLAFLFRLNLTADRASGRSESVVTEIFEVLSSEQVQVGMSAITLTIPKLSLMPNEFSMYLWLGRIDCTTAYDTVDENISLPKLVIKARSPSARPLHGLVPISYEIRRSDLESAVPETLVEQRN
jgi:ABC-type polysaccharide/polyol phosphate transport system ATPase subunit